MDDPLIGRSATDLLEAQRTGAVRARELLAASVARMRAFDGAPLGLRAVLRLNPDAERQAEHADAASAQGRLLGPLHGVPVVVKDNMHMAGLATTAGCAALHRLRATRDAEIVRRIRASGAVIVGKTNLHEMAAGVTTISSLGGQTRNPWAPGRTPGGSSGGTAVAVAASYVPLGWGTDTCGSIRLPASHCGLYGLRPTGGTGPMDGIVPLSGTQDTVGPLSRTLADLAVALDVTCGDRFRAAGAGPAAPFRTAVADPPDPGRIRIGVLEGLFDERSRMGRRTTARVRRSLDALAARGVDVVSVPCDARALRGVSLIAHEFKFDLADFLAAEAHAPVRSLGDILDSGLYHQALGGRFRVRDRPTERDSLAAEAARAAQAALARTLTELLDDHEAAALAYPSSRVAAWRIGTRPRGSNAEPAAHSGLPAISVPVGLGRDGLPVGLELLGRRGEDPRLLQIATFLEDAWRGPRLPPLCPPLVDGKIPGRVRAPLRVTPVGSTSVLEVRARLETGGQLLVRWATDADDDSRWTVLVAQRRDGRPGPVVGPIGPPDAPAGEARLALDAADLLSAATGSLELVVLGPVGPPTRAPLPVELPGSG